MIGGPNIVILLVAEVILGLLTGIIGIIVGRTFARGILSSAIIWIAIGQVTMSIGHIVMAVDMLYGINTLNIIFGQLGGTVFLIVAVISLASSAIGFVQLFRLGRRS